MSRLGHNSATSFFYNAGRVMKVRVAWILVAALALGLAGPMGCGRAPARAGGAVRQEAYVWQRSWDEGVRAAVAEAGGMAGFTALAAEVSWEEGKFRAVKVGLDYEALKATGKPVGLTLRIGPYPGPFQAEGEPIGRIADLAEEIIAAAGSKGLTVSELQIDFDCADAKLAGYRAWVVAIKKRIAPAPVVITVLPSWLRQAEFKKLARQSDGFVLQVHSLADPAGPDAPFSLCDPEKSRAWIETAARLGLPFRVALPTYGYLMAFDAQGKLTGLIAEGPAPLLPPGTQLREVRSDPVALAGLVQSLTHDRPANLLALIWYRLPIPADRLNWPLPTLAAVMAGRPPRSSIRAEAKTTEPGLVDIELINDGEKDEASDLLVTITWSGARLVASDGLRGFQLSAIESGEAQLHGPSGPGAVRLRPGDRWPVGWLRFDRGIEVKVHVESDQK
jgi:hypothetical protein